MLDSVENPGVDLDVWDKAKGIVSKKIEQLELALLVNDNLATILEVAIKYKLKWDFDVNQNALVVFFPRGSLHVMHDVNKKEVKELLELMKQERKYKNV